jgi:hypothetical protein
MPNKHNVPRRHKIPKMRYKVTNWPAYNAALRSRGDMTIWFTEDAIAAWRPAKTGHAGRPQEYSDIAIETALMIREVFHLPLRQTAGFMNSVVRMLKLEIDIPDYTCISKRSDDLSPALLDKAHQPGSLVIVDSTGLKVYGRDEWHQEKHAVAARRIWRKLHIAIDENHYLIACDLTTTDVGDTSAVPGLLAQIDHHFKTFIADGAYDGEPVSKAVLEKQAEAQLAIPPPKTATLSGRDTQRDRHIQAIADDGRLGWQTGYNLKARIALAIQRFKRIFGNVLKAKILSRQQTETRIAATALNRMTALGMPIFIKIA